MSLIYYWQGPFSGREISICFDKENAENFSKKIADNLRNGETCIFPAKFIKSQEIVDSKLVMEFTEDENLEFIQIKKNSLTLALSNESIDYAIFKVEEFLRSGDFSPSEYYSMSEKGKKTTIQIYFTNSFPELINL